LFCPGFLLLSANFRIDDWLNALYVGVVPFRFATLIFCFIRFQQLFKQVILCLATITPILTFVPLNSQPHAVTMESISELIFIALMLAFLITLRVELGRLKVDVVILRDESK
jgi:hypothetical protein